MEITSDETKVQINVRALISKYEIKATTVETINPRARTRSLGNILAKNVTVKYNDFKTLDKVQDVLGNFEERLEQYDVYNKEKHVALQEELFNILTSIINIDHDDPDKAKYLITKTKSLVSSLNNKLPSYNFTNRREIELNEMNTSKTDGTESLHRNKTAKNDEVDSIVNEELHTLRTVASVRTLKEKFQTIQPEGHYKIESKTTKIKETGFKSSIQLVTNKTYEGTDQTKVDEGNASISVPQTHIEPQVEVNNKVSVSVQQLRNIFEKKSEENASGLPLILKEAKSPLTRFNYKSNLLNETNPEDLKQIEVSSYIPREEPTGLLQILKRETPEFHYELNINDENENTEESNHTEIVNSTENGEDDPMDGLDYEENSDIDEYDYEDSSSSSTNTVKSGESVVLAKKEDTITVDDDIVKEGSTEIIE